MADTARGEHLLWLRGERHLSQEQAAHEVGVSVKTYRAWEKGGAIQWKNARRVAELFDVDPESLVSREGADERPGPAGIQDQIQELVGGQALLLAELEKVQRQLQALQANQRQGGRSARGSRNG